MSDLSACESLTQQSFQLKGRLFTMSVLQLHNTAIGPFKAQLHDLIKQAPKFFANSPMVLDLQGLNGFDSIDFPSLIDALRDRSMVAVGILGGSPAQQQQAQECGLAIINGTKQAVDESANALTSGKKKTAKPVEPKITHTKIIDKPVRSGQQIYARDGNLVILSSVSQGAEILADGSIHVYGPLRGRALAGIAGDTTARIFCTLLDAELVSIAGRYIANESLQQYKNSNAMQIMLRNDKIHIEPMA